MWNMEKIMRKKKHRIWEIWRKLWEERDSKYEKYRGNYEKKETANMKNVEKIMRRERQQMRKKLWEERDSKYEECRENYEKKNVIARSWLIRIGPDGKYGTAGWEVWTGSFRTQRMAAMNCTCHLFFKQEKCQKKSVGSQTCKTCCRN
jgi:hypothetical protein